MWKPPKSSFSLEEAYDHEEEEDDEEEEDYMSDAFLSKCANTTQDIRPGIPMTYSMKRKLELEKKKELREKSLSELRRKTVSQKDRLDEGLSTALGEDNKGFSLLQKMGYKPGTSLGKEGGGQLEPIRVEVKHDRGGLGLKQMLMERKREKERRYLARIKKHNMEFDPNKFREQKRQQLMAKQLEADLSKCQRACHRLDTEQNITDPMEPYFWPQYFLPKEVEEDAEEDAEEDRKHDDQTGVGSGSTSGDLATTSRANSGTQGGEEEEWWGGVEEAAEDGAPQPWQTEILVDVVSTYLRNAYFYCIWCGAAYDDYEDLEQSCPGTTRQDHDD